MLTNPLEGKIDNFIDKLNNFELKMSELLSNYNKAKKKHSTFKYALRYIEETENNSIKSINDLTQTMHSIESLLYGNKSKKEIGEKEDPTIFERLSISKRGFYGNSYGPTKLHMKSLRLQKINGKKLSQK